VGRGRGGQYWQQHGVSNSWIGSKDGEGKEMKVSQDGYSKALFTNAGEMWVV